MPQTALPNLGINYDWDAGVDAWKAGVDRNFVLTDAWALGHVIDQRNAQPGGPGAGDAYIIGPVPTGAAWVGNANALAVWDNNNTTWVISAPSAGWQVYDQALNVFRLWDGTRWQAREQAIAQAAAITIDGTHYGATIELDTNAAARDVTIPQESSDALPDGFHFWVVNNSGANNVTFTLTGLTTRGIAPITTDRGALRIVKVGTDTWVSS